jgi:hypothetical protein
MDLIEKKQSSVSQSWHGSTYHVQHVDDVGAEIIARQTIAHKSILRDSRTPPSGARGLALDFGRHIAMYIDSMLIGQVKASRKNGRSALRKWRSVVPR